MQEKKKDIILIKKQKVYQMKNKKNKIKNLVNS